MPRFRIHRIKGAPGENFRWAAHTGGSAVVKSKDYDLGGEVDAPTAYAAWKVLATDARPLRPGDLLETVNPEGLAGELQIAKYIGFEPAQWYVPEPKPETNPPSAAESAATESVSNPL
jgi:hypothetical protein